MAETAATLPVPPLDAENTASTLLPFTRDVVSYSTASLLFLIVNTVCAFLIPRIVSVESYAIYKLFLLYGGYVGILHFGSLDGALVRWARQPHSIHREFSEVLFVALASCVAALGFAVSSWLMVGSALQPVFIVAFSLFAITNIATTVVQFAMQASRRFQELSALSLIQPVTFLLTLVAVKTLGNIGETELLASYVASSVLALGIYLLRMRTSVDWKVPSARAAWHLGTTHYRIGAYILLSNLGLNLLLGLDRLFLSARFPLREFALYSFAASVFYSVCLLIQALAKVVFPYVSQRTYAVEQNVSFLCTQRAVLAVWAFGLGVYFPLDWLIRQLLPAYVGAIPALRIAMLGLAPVAVTQIVHSNYFRAFGGERRLLLGTCIGLCTFGLSLRYAVTYHTLSAIAWAAVAGHAAWWVANEALLWRNTERRFRSSMRDLGSMGFVVALFLWCSQRPTPTQMMFYLVLVAVGMGLILGPRTLLTVAERYVFAGEANS